MGSIQCLESRRHFARATLARTRCSVVALAVAILVTGDRRLNSAPMARLTAELPAVVVTVSVVVVRTGNKLTPVNKR